MISKLLLSLVLCLAPITSFAKAKKAKTTFSPALISVVSKYKASSLVTMKVNKKIKSELMGKETTYLGTISLSGEKFRLDTNTPDKAMILFDGVTLWNVQYPPAELGGPVQVLKSKINKQNRSQILLSALLDKDSLKKNFKVQKEEKLKDQTIVVVEPLTDDLTVKSIEISLNVSKNILNKISYKDDVGNLTTMDFSDVQFAKKIPNDLFKFKLPKDAQVTDL
jgi:outer membrane lipoprotein carrier protein